MFIFFAKKINHTKGFTLAEVLITLGIIGVVASLTIPLIQNYQKTQYVEALKKAYATTNQALKQMSADYGCIDDLKCTGLFNSTVTNQHYVLGEALVKYFKISKNCGTTVNNSCWPLITNKNYDGSFTGTNDTFDDYTYYKFITADGMSYAIGNYKNNCDTASDSSGKTGHMSQDCGTITIDINGLKKPNQLGRDTFWFFITNGKGASLYPRGGIDDNYGGNYNWWDRPSKLCNSSNKNGSSCTGKIVEQGWSMNY